MQEVTIKLKFNAECLGAVRRPECIEFLKDPNGRVMFLSTWWRSIVTFAAKVLGRHQDLVAGIEWNPVVEGTPTRFRRYYEPGRFALHEAFAKGAIIAVHAVLPDGLEIDNFRSLLEIAGSYKGMSPYRPDKRYGTFEVIGVTPRHRTITAHETGSIPE